MSIEITMPVSGQTVRINRLRYEMLVQVQHRCAEELAPKKPQPPKQKVVIASGEEQEIENPTHPDYLAQLERFNAAVTLLSSERLARLIAHAGIADPLPDNIPALMEIYKQTGVPISDDPKIFWVLMVIAPGADDFNFLIFEIFGRSMAREGQIALWREMFRGHVPGKVDLEYSDS
jgi:hypothetical protein